MKHTYTETEFTALMMGKAYLEQGELALRLPAVREMFNDPKLSKLQRDYLKQIIKEGDILERNAKRFKPGENLLSTNGKYWAVTKGGKQNG